ncbi:MAG: hypothetical protein HC872_03600 [Gammaproteobacteria bacterium]|nr:hypothetical protein [Gammaproteobacteria bacterium]
MTGKRRNSRQSALTVINGKGRMATTRSRLALSRVLVEQLPTRIHFSRGGSTPTGASLSTLNQYAAWLREEPQRKIYLLGHANQKLQGKLATALADERALTVRDLLVWMGADRTQVSRIKPSRIHRLRGDSTPGQRRSHRCVELIVAPSGRPAMQAQKPDIPVLLKAGLGSRRRPPRW